MTVRPPDVPSAPMPERMLLGGPEGLFGVVDEPGAAGDGRVARVEMGPWSTSGSRPQLAYLGVLVDDVLGYSVNDHLGGWSVSTELSVDVLGPLPGEGVVECRAGVPHQDVSGSMATTAHGEVRDESGRIVARAVLRGRAGRLAPQRGTVIESPVPRSSRAEHASIESLLDPYVSPVRDGLRVRVVPQLLNPFGILHGGVHFALVEWVGSMALPGLTTASTRLQLLRGVPDDSVLDVTSRVVHAGRTLGVVHVECRDAAGRLCSLGTVVRH